MKPSVAPVSVVSLVGLVGFFGCEGDGLQPYDGGDVDCVDAVCGATVNIGPGDTSVGDTFTGDTAAGDTLIGDTFNGDAFVGDSVPPGDATPYCPPAVWLSSPPYSYDAYAFSGKAIVTAGTDTVIIGGSHAGIGPWVVRKSVDAGVSWQTIDEFRTPSALDNQIFAMSLGNSLAVAGYGYGASINAVWTVRASPDLGTTWDTIDSYNHFPQQNSRAFAVTETPTAMLVAGDAYDGVRLHTIIRRKGAGDTAFSTVDTFQFEAGYSSTPHAMTYDSGSVFVGLEALASAPAPQSGRWLVRRSTDDGLSWSSVDEFQLVTGGGCAVWGLAGDGNGAMYAVGSCQGLVTSHWLVRRSDDGGDTWATVDDFQVDGESARASSVTVAPNGDVYVAGKSDVNGQGFWTVRHSTDFGSTWCTVDSFQLEPGADAVANAVAVNSAGGLFTVGTAVDANGDTFMLSRRDAAIVAGPGN